MKEPKAVNGFFDANSLPLGVNFLERGRSEIRDS